MGASGWFLFAVLSAASLAGALWLYRRRETPGRGRSVLALLRWSVLTVALLLLFDPQVPVAGMAGERRTQVIVDGSLSMRAPAGAQGGVTRWEQASAEAARLAPAGGVLVFGATTRAVAAESLSVMTPSAPSSRLLPALQAAAEAGVEDVVVLSDGRIEDAAEVRRWLPSLGLDIEFREIGDTTLANRALVELVAPRWAEAGQPAEIGFGVVATGTPSDSIRAVLLRDGEAVAEAATPWPQEGRVATGTLRFTAQAGDEPVVRYEVRLSGEDLVPDDDARTAYLRVSERPAGVVAIGLRPDWELRFLQPVLQQALGLPVQGFILTREFGFVRGGGGLDAGDRVEVEDVRAAAAGADLLVLQGIDASTPDWIFGAAAGARRLLVLPQGDVQDLGLPLEMSRPAAGEWYASAEVPPSPVAPLLAGITTEDVPPLTGLARPEVPSGAWAPLLATRGRLGQPAPLLIAGETEGRRWAVATGEGYWRWAFRTGPSRDLYARLWSAVAGWLVREQAAVAAAALWPVSAVVHAGEGARFVAPGLEADSFRLSLSGDDGAVKDTVVGVRRDTAVIAAHAPGHYTWTATAFAGDSAIADAEGVLSVEQFSPDFARPRVTLADLRTDAVALAGPSARGGRPLHALPWAYLLLVGLIAAEWVLRRRWGLR